ncbi:MAG: iron complex outermembrane receptor protein [Oleispira sp.]|jgi:iron complex outermembrane receptor protein
MKSVFLPSCFMLSLLSQQVLAANQEAASAASAVKLDKQTISTSRGEKDASTIPHMVTVIESEALQLAVAASGDIMSALSKLLPSFSPTRQKLTGSAETFRGRTPLFLVDGIPQSNPLRDGARDGFTIDPSLIARIEVIHGANASMGLGASGGIINIITRKNADIEGVQQHVNTSITSADNFEGDSLEYKLGYSIAAKKDAFDVLASVQLKESGLYYDADGDKIGVSETHGDLMDSSQQDYFVKLGYDINESERLELLANYYQIENSGDYVNVPGDRDAGIGATTKKGDPLGDPNKNLTTNVAITYSNSDLAGGILATQLYYQEREAQYGSTATNDRFQDITIAPVGTLYDQSSIKSNRTGIRSTYDKINLADTGINIVAGFDIMQLTAYQEMIQTGRKWVPEIDLLTYAPFVQLERQFFEKLTLSSGLRYETSEVSVDDYTTLAYYGGRDGATPGNDVDGGKDNSSESLLNFGAIYAVTDELSLYTSYAEGFALPSIGSILRGIEESNVDVDTLVDIKPVISENYEIGFNYNSADWHAQLSYFQSDSKLGTTLVQDETGSYKVKRQKTQVKGYELQLSYWLNHAVEVGGYYSQLIGRTDSTGNGRLDSDLLSRDISPDKLSTFVNADLSDTVKLNVQANHYFDRSFSGPGADSAGALDFESYSIVDLSVAWILPKGTLTSSVGNLLGEQYFDYYAQTNNASATTNYMAGRGRILTVGYGLDF